MKFSNKSQQSSFIKLKDNDWVQRQRIAGRVTSQTLSMLMKAVKDGTTDSMLELNARAEQFIESQGCSATFKNYKSFPAGVCISVNKQLVHGIPTDYRLKPGDVVSFDLGATFEGAIADSAVTVVYGAAQSPRHTTMLSACEEALEEGIRAIKPGRQIGAIGAAIYKVAKNSDFGLITQYGGHGICENRPHAEPFVANRALPNQGIRVQPGLTVAIEPMLIDGSTSTVIDRDGWTVVGNNISCHFEHTIFVHKDRLEIMTRREDDVRPKFIEFV